MASSSQRGIENKQTLKRQRKHPPTNREVERQLQIHHPNVLTSAGLADQAVDLNLKLIKWRISPGLNLDVIKRTKCLLLGAGTLGSYVARTLLGWGVRKITFVDSGSVSYSNPVRQPLFNFRDCVDGGVKKAHRAAEALKEIYPSVETEGHIISVPMAGHPIQDESAIVKDYEELVRLVNEHDAIFLLMDTRESRWLPTVMGKAAGKIVMNAALGFDSFVVMRHGQEDVTRSQNELGCYFCSDVVAPANVQRAAEQALTTIEMSDSEYEGDDGLPEFT
ncbi:MAG: hypothetical protein Q9219_007577 [cf. Caloplaca sp. 3 TL-2023]